MMILFNMGLPMIVPVMYLMTVALIPIVLIEAGYLAKRLAVSFRYTIGPVVFGNLVSTLVGIPASWFILLIVQFATGGASGYGASGFWRKFFSFTLQAPWLLPIGENESWIFPAALLFLLVPFFLATWLVEYIVMRNRLAATVTENRSDDIDLKDAERLVFRGIREANLISYGMIAFLTIVVLVFSLAE